MKNNNIAAVEVYINSLKQHDLLLAALADDIYFEGPVAGKGIGADNFRVFLSGFLPAIDDVRIHLHVCESEHVATHWEVDKVFGVIRIPEKFRVRDGKPIESIAYFDPRPTIGG